MTPHDHSALLDERYGRHRRSPRRIAAWAGLGLASAVAIVALGWTTVAGSLASVDVDDTGFVVADEHSVTLSFQITDARGRAVACILEAQDEEHGIVGWRVVEYPATDEHARAFTEQVPTVALATTGLVNSCWVP